MKTVAKIGGFVLGLVLVFTVAAGIGRAVGSPADTSQPSGKHTDTHGGTDNQSAAPDVPGGVLVAQDGYRLRLIDAQAAPAREAKISFQIIGPDGNPVTRYTREHAKDLHLIAVRRDLTGFQHVHPTRDGAGTWSTELDLAVPGPYRIFADFTPAERSDGLTLGADLAVAGPYAPRGYPADKRSDEVAGYRVTMAGHLESETDSEVTVTVTRNGRPVTDLDPYLEAYGHLVALREGDLAYLHVHPVGHPADGTTAAGPTVTFRTDIPSPGRYRLFLDFSHHGSVRTAEFTVLVQEH